MNRRSFQILVIDDDTRLRTLLGKFLSENGFDISLAKDTAEARELMTKTNFDLLVLDVMMPNENGVDFTATIRTCSKIPIIMLTARSEFDDRIKGLEAGADDYLQKPFEPKELLLRINNLLRRSNKSCDEGNIFPVCPIDIRVGDQRKAGRGSCHVSVSRRDKGHIFCFGDFVFNLAESRLKKGESFIHITDAEAKILGILCKEKGTPISREKLSSLCGNIDDRSIDVQITRLRKKVETNPKQPHYLQTVRNFGYVIRG